MLLTLPFVVLNSQSLLTMEYSNLPQDKYKLLLSTAVIIPFFGFLFLEIFFFIFQDFIIQTFHLPLYLLYLIPVFLLFQVFPTILPVVFQAKKEPINFGKYKISLTIVNVLLSLLFVINLNYGWEGRLFGIILSFFIFSLVSLVIMLKTNLIKFHVDINNMKKLFNFGIPLIPHVIATILLASVPKLLLSGMINNEAVGIFTVSLQVASITIIIMTSINQGWTPNFYESLNKNPDLIVKKGLVMKTYKMMIMMALITLVVIISIPYIYLYFIDVRYHIGILTSQIIAVGMLINGWYFLMSSYLLFLKKTKELSIITISASIIGAILSYYFILNFDLIGTAFGIVTTYCLLFFTIFYFSNKLYPMPWTLK